MMVAPAPPAPTPPPRRYHSLDSLRAVMMLLGIVLHAFFPYLPSLDEDFPFPFHDDQSAAEAFGLGYFVIHSFRMPIFFVMAGFFAAMSLGRRGRKGLLVDRFRRIVVPFAVGWVVLFPILAGSKVFFHAGGGVDGARESMRALLSGRLYAEPNPTHLWFLYYLAIIYPPWIAAGWLLRRIGPAPRRWLHDAFRVAMRSPIRPAWFAIPTALALWRMSPGGFDTPVSFRPSLTVLLTYVEFFGFGWMLHSQVDLLQGLTRHAWKTCGLALLLLPLNLKATLVEYGALPGWDPRAHAVAAVTGAAIAWLSVFGLTGLFLRYLDRSVPWMRYLTEASYWCYLTHYPILFWAAALVAPLPIGSPLKLVMVIGMTTGASLVAYHLGVRSTFIGRCLNGGRASRRGPGRLRPLDVEPGLNSTRAAW